MPESFWDAAFRQGGFAVLAGLSIYLMFVMYQGAAKRDKDRFDEEIQRGKEVIDRERQDKAILIDVLTRNTDSSTRLNEAISRIDRHIDGLNRRVEQVSKEP